MNKSYQQITPGIPDSEFVRGNVPMTKEEVRTITIAKLKLCKDDVFLDIGAGTGSVSVEVARLIPSAKVYAIEHKAEAVELIKQNVAKFELTNIEVIHAKALEALESINGVNKVFIGGSSGQLEGIINWIVTNCSVGTRIVVNAVTLDTLFETRKQFANSVFSKPEIIQVGITKVETVAGVDMLRAQSPIFIITTELIKTNEI